MTQALEQLQNRVREATGSDRDLDHAILETLLPRTRTDLLFYGTPFTSDPEGLGACVALLREVVPGVVWVRTDDWTEGKKTVSILFEPTPNTPVSGTGVTLCAAYIDAIISAKLCLSKEKEALSQNGEG